MKKQASLLQYTKGYRIPAILTPLLISCEVFLEIAIPFIMGQIIDIGFASGDIALIRNRAILIIFAALLSLTTGALSAYSAAKASSGFAKNLRLAVFSKIQTFSFHNIDKFTPGGLITRLTGDVVRIMHAYQMIIRIAVRLPVMIIFALVMSFTIAPSLATIYMIAIPGVVALIALLMGILLPLYSKGFKIVDRTNEITGENIRAMRLVKSFVREDEEKRKFNSINIKHYKIFVKANYIFSVGAPIMRGIIYTCLLLLAYNGAKGIVAGTLSTGELLSVLSYNTQIFFSLMMFAMTLSMIMMSTACYSRIKEVLREEASIKEKENPVQEVKDGSIIAENLSFSYFNDENKLALEDINFNIPSGSVVGIVGQTGSGKSTLISLFARFYDVTKGSLKVGGIDTREYSIKTLRDSVSIVLQKNTLFSGTIRSTLLWGREDATDEEIYKALETAQIREFVEGLEGGLDHRVEQEGENFSGGQKQRLCIARAILKKPKIIVMDDSSSALDMNTEARLRKALKENHSECTKVIIAQKIASVKDSDIIIVLKEGRVESIGKHDELLQKSSFYSTLDRVQNMNREAAV